MSSQQSAVSNEEQVCLSQKKHESAGLIQSQASVSSLLSEAVAELTTHKIPNPRLEAEVLLAHVVQLERAGLYARLRGALAATQIEAFRHLIQRRTRHEPLQYLTGTQEFWSLAFKVDKRVLIPRPETEVVVETALRLISQPATQVLDVGTGSGCIAVALAKELSQAEVWAIDVSADALAVARENAQRHHVITQTTFLQGDFFTPVTDMAERFDVIVSNPPYIVHDELATLQPEVRDWEPREALDGGRDGLDFYRHLIGEGPHVLRSGGWLITEIGQGQRNAIMRLIQEQPSLTASWCVPDYAGQDRVVVARRA